MGETVVVEAKAIKSDTNNSTLKTIQAQTISLSLPLNIVEHVVIQWFIAITFK